jgi:hypothetical protein
LLRLVERCRECSIINIKRSLSLRCWRCCSFRLRFQGSLLRKFRFLLHVLPGGLHRIRHYGLLANPVRRANLTRIRVLLHAPAVINASDDASPDAMSPTFVCRHCGAPMIIIDILLRSQPIRAPPTSRGNA